MRDNVTHDIKNVLHRLELMSELLAKKDFTSFSENEIREDVKNDLTKLAQLFSEISSDQ